MATLTKVKKVDREKALALAVASGARTLAGGLNLPDGIHSFLVAEKEAFGILNVESKASGKWALPIVAGTVTVAGTNEKIIFELSEKPGAKTLVIPDNFFISMQTNTVYAIEVGAAGNGRKVVKNVTVATEVAAGEEDND